jgi:hypothetical protein
VDSITGQGQRRAARVQTVTWLGDGLRHKSSLSIFKLGLREAIDQDLGDNRGDSDDNYSSQLEAKRRRKTAPSAAERTRAPGKRGS